MEHKAWRMYDDDGLLNGPRPEQICLASGNDAHLEMGRRCIKLQ